MFRIFKTKPVQADTRSDLKELLKDRVAGGVFLRLFKNLKKNQDYFQIEMIF